MVVAYAYRSNGGAAVLGRGTLTSLLTEPDSVPLLNEGTLQLSFHLQRPFSIQRLHPFPSRIA